MSECDNIGALTQSRDVDSRSGAHRVFLGDAAGQGERLRARRGVADPSGLWRQWLIDQQRKQACVRRFD